MTDTRPAQPADLYYDPYDFEIDADPYPIWKRMRDEAPLYYNEKHGFYALSRWDDVEPAMKDFAHYSSAKSTVLELIKADVEIPPGMMIFDDPPIHTAYRGLMSRVFTPRRMNALEPQVRDLAARLLDPHVDSTGFDVIDVIGRELPMRVIGMLLGIPEGDQAFLREQLDDGLRLKEGAMPNARRLEEINASVQDQMFGQFIDHRIEHPSDDLMTELINAEFEDHTGVTRSLTRDEVLGYVRLLAGAGNETTTKFFGWAVKSLGEHPGQRRQLAADRSLVPQAVEEILRYEAPSPVNSRYVTTDVELYGQTVPAGSPMVLLNGSANRDQRHWGPTGDEFDIHRKIDHHVSFGFGLHFCLGAALARMEGRVLVDEFIARFPEYDVDLTNAEMAHTSTVRGWDKLPITIT